jgi:hypothetical protein
MKLPDAGIGVSELETMRQLFAYNQSIFFLPYYWEDIFGMGDVTAFGTIRQPSLRLPT